MNLKPLIDLSIIDLKKAFDTVDHGILLKKLDLYGIRGVSGDFLRSYLSNRSQFVFLGTTVSSKEHITCDVPQGLVLGPILFNNSHPGEVHHNNTVFNNIYKKLFSPPS